MSRSSPEWRSKRAEKSPALSFCHADIMAIIGVVGYAYVVSPSAAMYLLANDFFDSLESYSLTAIPLFVLMGQVAWHAGIAGRLYDSANKFLGHVRGGLAVATVAGAVMFKAICGSSVATVA